MTAPHDKALTATAHEITGYIGGTCCHRTGGLKDDPTCECRQIAEAAVSTYLSSIGGIVCTRDPVGAWYEDGTGCFHMSLNVELEEKKARENGHQIHYFHEPIEAGNGGARWLPIDRADKSIDRIIEAAGLRIGNSEEYWVRDADGRAYQAVWSDDGRKAYWWDLEGESPVDPVEFMPHPLDLRFSSILSHEGRKKA